MATLLPAGFESLEPFAARFAIAGTAARAQLRSDTSAAERQEFYDAASGRIAAALELLDAKPLSELDAAEERLMNLCLAFAHIALAVEIQGPRRAAWALAATQRPPPTPRPLPHPATGATVTHDRRTRIMRRATELLKLPIRSLTI